MRVVHRWFSTDTPSHTFLGHGREGPNTTARSGRLVSTWKVCQCACAMTSKIDATKLSSMAS